MRTTKTIALALVVGLVALIAASAARPSGAAGVPREFFGIAPQTNPTLDDVEHMRAGRIGSMRWPLVWETVQPTAKSEYDWTGYDEIVEMAARGHMRVLPFLYGTPSWLSHRYTVLPIDSARKRSGWTEFVEAAVERYGPHGEFWSEHGPGSREPLPRIPVRDWQVWNEANFFYFATPASPQRYAKLLKLTSAAIKGVEPSARVILSGLFGDPTAQPPNGLPAVQFLKQLYRVPGIKSEFDAVALHPYADEAVRLEELVEEVRAVVLENHDPGAGLYITEMGWGSQNDPNTVSFERGVRGQVTELRRGLRIPDRKPPAAQHQGDLLVLLEGPPRRLQLLRLGRLLLRQQAPAGEARLARLRRSHRRPSKALAAPSGSSSKQRIGAASGPRSASAAAQPGPGSRSEVQISSSSGVAPKTPAPGALGARLSPHPAPVEGGGALGVGPLDVDPDLALGGDRHQRQLPRVAEVEPDRRRLRRPRLSAGAFLELDPRRVGPQVAAENRAERPAGGDPTPASARDLDRARAAPLGLRQRLLSRPPLAVEPRPPDINLGHIPQRTRAVPRLGRADSIGACPRLRQEVRRGSCSRPTTRRRISRRSSRRSWPRCRPRAGC